MTDVDEAGLSAAVQLWLQTESTRLLPSFPPGLEAQYIRDEGPRRIRAGHMPHIVGAAVATILLPLLLAELKDVQGLIWICWAGIALPVQIFGALMPRFNLAYRRHQALRAVNAAITLGCATIVLTASRYASGAELLGFTLMVVQMDIASARQRAPLSLVLGCIIAAVFGFGIQLVPGITPAGGIILFAIVSICTLFAVNDSVHLERAIRRNYAMALRDRLKQHDLFRRNRELAALARSDPLTGLANRRAFDSWLAALWHEALPTGEPLGMIMLDVDCFKAYNDFYGHPAGDTCLQAVARCLREQLRNTSDLVARIGGEEFAVLMPGVSLEMCGEVAERLRQAVAGLDMPHLGAAPGQEVLSVSAGAASIVPAPGILPGQLAALADSALYAAKAAGRNRIMLAVESGERVEVGDMKKGSVLF
jgi:diguanylate cyclase (GGDEF)-like protein